MTDEASPDQPDGGPDLGRLLEDWTTLWREELRAQTDGLAGTSSAKARDAWDAAMALWADTLPLARPGDAGTRRTAASPRAQTAAAAPDPRDDAIERLARRVAELEARIVSLEASGRRARR